MTKMKRTSVSLSDSGVAKIEQWRRMPEYANCTYSEIIRRLVVRGLEVQEKEKSA